MSEQSIKETRRTALGFSDSKEDNEEWLRTNKSDWDQSKPSVKNEGIIGSNWTTGPKGFGPGLRAIFANPDNYLCNDCDRIQKECECPASIKEE